VITHRSGPPMPGQVAANHAQVQVRWLLQRGLQTGHSRPRAAMQRLLSLKDASPEGGVGPSSMTIVWA
jgi:hypothetical protein